MPGALLAVSWPSERRGLRFCARFSHASEGRDPRQQGEALMRGPRSPAFASLARDTRRPEHPAAIVSSPPAAGPHSRGKLKDQDQQDRERDIDPARRHTPGNYCNEYAPERYHHPESGESERGSMGRYAALAAEIKHGPVAVEGLDNTVEKYG